MCLFCLVAAVASVHSFARRCWFFFGWFFLCIHQKFYINLFRRSPWSRTFFNLFNIKVWLAKEYYGWIFIKPKTYLGILSLFSVSLYFFIFFRQRLSNAWTLLFEWMNEKLNVWVCVKILIVSGSVELIWILHHPNANQHWSFVNPSDETKFSPHLAVNLALCVLCINLWNVYLSSFSNEKNPLFLIHTL